MKHFNFPPTTFSEQNDSATQVDHVLSEAVEVANAENLLEQDREMADLVHSSETYWRIRRKEMGDDYVDMIFDKT